MTRLGPTTCGLRSPDASSILFHFSHEQFSRVLHMLVNFRKRENWDYWAESFPFINFFSTEKNSISNNHEIVRSANSSINLSSEKLYALFKHYWAIMLLAERTKPAIDFFWKTVVQVQWVVRVWADQTREGLGDPPCSKIGYCEPGGAGSWEGSPTLAESVWVFSALWYSILIGWRGFGFFRARFWLAGDKNLVLG